jgi:hypothetical protein
MATGEEMSLIQRNGKLSGSANVCHRTQGCPQRREEPAAKVIITRSRVG